MRNKKLAVIWLILAVAFVVLGVLEQSFRGILLAAGVLFFILAYAANRPALPVDPMTGEPREDNDVVKVPESGTDTG
jgi:hypothetical protein